MIVYYYYTDSGHPTDKQELLDSLYNNILKTVHEEFIYDPDLRAVQIIHEGTMYTIYKDKDRLPKGSESILDFYMQLKEVWRLRDLNTDIGENDND